jgi:hypothetical protein
VILCATTASSRPSGPSWAQLQRSMVEPVRALGKLSTDGISRGRSVEAAMHPHRLESHGRGGQTAYRSVVPGVDVSRVTLPLTAIEITGRIAPSCASIPNGPTHAARAPRIR